MIMSVHSLYPLDAGFSFETCLLTLNLITFSGKQFKVVMDLYRWSGLLILSTINKETLQYLSTVF